MTTTSTATKPKPDRAEINRRNARKSTGPRTTGGKARSKFNAVKHGMTARTLVLPGEDPQKLQLRLETWTDELQPQGEVEQFLLEQAVHSSWKLERAERAELARLSHLIESVPIAEANREQEVAVALGFWLFSDRGNDAEPGLQDNVLNVLGTGPASAKGPGHLDFLDHPQAIVFRLESTAAGCRWLLDRWAELRAELDQGRLWSHDQQVNAVRMLGKRPLDGTSCHDVVDPFQWCADIERPDDDDLERRERCARWLLRQLDERLPAPELETLAAFQGIAERAMARLETIAATHRRRAEADDPAARLSFDASAEGERLRRYQFSCSRNLFRGLDALIKVRRSGLQATGDERSEEDGLPPFAEETVAVKPEVGDGAMGAIDPVVPAGGIVEPTAGPVLELAPATSDREDPPEGPTDPPIDCVDSQDEPAPPRFEAFARHSLSVLRASSRRCCSSASASRPEVMAMGRPNPRP